ncbi:MAG: dimethyl sulfoxide reductase anchor subunit [Slackia sp.]|nr:dimethyl sulfoxide reductase anchor subunit [Slackia sp.]
MEAALNELPLAIFTTLAPLGAGAFVVLAVAACSLKLDGDALKAVDRFSLIPAALVLVGFIASFFHLAAPLHAVGVFAGIGHSPLSNEIAVGAVFFVAMALYVILGLAGKLTPKVRRPFAAVVAVLALVFAVFTGLAYMMPTIPSWNSPLVPIEMLAMALLGGTPVGMLALSLAGALEKRTSHMVKSLAFMLVLIGFVGSAVALVGHFDMLGELWSPAVAGATLADPVMPFMVAAAVCAVIVAVLMGVACFGKKNATVFSAVASCVALAGVFLVRFSFYAVQMSIGL